MNWDSDLLADEQVEWEGRPAPRCYTFRNWKHSVFGILFLLVASFWEVVGMQMAAAYQLIWLKWLPVPFILFGFYLSFGHLLLARLEWSHVFYCVTDRRIIARRGLFARRVQSLKLAEVSYFRLRPQGEQLGTLRVHGGENQPVLTLHCIEYPRRVTDLLEDEMAEHACRLADRDAD